MGTPHKFVGKVRQEIADAYASGEALKSIAARHGSNPSTIYRIAIAMGAAKRAAGITKMAKIIEIAQSNPELSAVQIAGIVGATVDYVRSIRRLCGLRRSQSGKALMVLRLSRDNPTLGAGRIARLAGVSEIYAKEVRRRYGIRAQGYKFASVSAATLNQGGLQGLNT